MVDVKRIARYPAICHVVIVKEKFSSVVLTTNQSGCGLLLSAMPVTVS
jgi:hypothetical protein